jgi:hypothetical protein
MGRAIWNGGAGGCGGRLVGRLCVCEACVPRRGRSLYRVRVAIHRRIAIGRWRFSRDARYDVRGPPRGDGVGLPSLELGWHDIYGWPTAPLEYGTRGPMSKAGPGTTWHVSVGPHRQWDTVLLEKSWS